MAFQLAKPMVLGTESQSFCPTVSNFSSFVKPFFSRSQMTPLFPLPLIPLAETISERTQAYVFNQWDLIHQYFQKTPTFTISCQPMFSTSMSYRYLKVNISKQNWYPLILILTSVLSLHYTSSFMPSSGLGILLDISHFYTLIQSLGSVHYHS